jgi:predicted DNA-binding protein
MTFRISPEKQERLREYALRKGLLIREVIEKGIDLVLEEEI